MSSNPGTRVCSSEVIVDASYGEKKQSDGTLLEESIAHDLKTPPGVVIERKTVRGQWKAINILGGK